MKKRIILAGYKRNELGTATIENIYDLPYSKTKRGYFLLIVNQKIDELLNSCDEVRIRINN